MTEIQSITTTTTRTSTPWKRRIIRVRNWFGRGLLTILLLILCLVTGGVVYESAMAAGDATRFPAPGQMVQVNGHGMHLNCTGSSVEGTPTVIFESGFGAWSENWVLVQPEVSQFTRACSYDRAGLGWSEP